MDARLRIKSPAALWLAGLIGAALGPVATPNALAGGPDVHVNIGASVNIDAHADVHEHVDVIEHRHVDVIERPVEVVREVTVVRPLSELICSGSLRYRVRSGDWCTHAHGTSRLELPLNVRVDAAPCRLNVPEVGFFEVGPHSCFSINRLADRRYSLVVESGSVHYSVMEDVDLRVASPYEGIGAWCVGGVRVARPVRRCSGRVAVDAEEGFQVFNLGGRLAYERGGRTVREVTSGCGLHVRLAAGVGMRSVAALPLERGLIIDEYAEDRGWDEVEVYRKSRGAGRGKGQYKEKIEYKGNGDSKMKYKREVEVEYDDEDTHGHQRGKGHEEHGNGKGLGHYKVKENKGKGHGRK